MISTMEPVPVDDARQAAERSLGWFFDAAPVEAGGPHAARWSLSNIAADRRAGAAVLAGRPTELFDVRGRLLFRDFTTRLRDGSELTVRTAAGPTVGTPVISLSVGPARPLDEWLARARATARERGYTGFDAPEALVCYSYPKLGLLCHTPAGTDVVIDLGDGSEHPTVADAERGLSELNMVWSPLDRVGSAEELNRRERWNAMTAALAPTFRPLSVERGGTAETEQKVLPGMTLIGQENEFYCAVATAKMILDRYHISKRQAEIAAAMKTSDGGTTLDDQVAGFAILSGGAFTASVEQPATFPTARTEVDGGRPLKSGVPGHARAVAGWKITAGTSRWLYVYDPWPPLEGKIYWESWEGIEHANLVLVKPHATA